MSTLVLKSTSIIKNPRFGKLPDLDTGLRFALDARDLELQNGAEVSRWIANRGIGSNAEKSFTGKNSALRYPIFDTTAGRKSVKFSGNHQIFNNNDNDYYVKTATYVVVAKINNLNPSQGGVARIFCGDTSDNTDGNNVGYTSDQYHYVAPFQNGLMMSTGGAQAGTRSVYGDTIPHDNTWFVGVFVFNGADSKMLTSNDKTIHGQPKLTHSKQDRIGLGTSFTITNSTQSGLDGNISFLAQYERVFTDNEMRTAIDYFSREFDI